MASLSPSRSRPRRPSSAPSERYQTSNEGNSPKGKSAGACSPLRRRPSSASSHVKTSLQSGLRSTCCTFGTAERFNAKVHHGLGFHSPKGKAYFGRNQLSFSSSEGSGRMASMGIGERPGMANYNTGHRVGPGTYDPNMSVSKVKSALDGPEMCTTTLKSRSAIGFGRSGTTSPGPRYDVRKNPGSDLPKYSLGLPQEPLLDLSGPGPAYLNIGTKMPSKEDLENRLVKSTFGIADRFPDLTKESQSPNVELYYTHNNIRNWQFDKDTRAASLGRGQRSPVGFSPHDLSPFTYPYQKCTGFTKKSSPLDGFRELSTSPKESPRSPGHRSFLS